MYFRRLLITCFMVGLVGLVGLVVSVWAGPGEEELAEAVITREIEVSAPQNEETTPVVLESVTT